MADTKLQIDIARMDERLKCLEELSKNSGNFAAKDIVEKQMPTAQIEKQLDQIESRLRDLESRPTKKWDSLIAALISAAISLIGAMLNRRY